MKNNLQNLSFEDLIIWCCAANEVELRNVIKETLSEHNFSFIEDNYNSYRNEKNKNLLFTRGNPDYCLVAHTDVCRDHSSFRAEISNLIPNPVIKNFNGDKIIQDKDCKVQVGGDDRLGVSIALWLALHTKQDMSILFTTDEEVGLLSAFDCKFKELSNFKLLIQIDRGNQSNQIVGSIMGLRLCDDKTLNLIFYLLEKNNIKRKLVTGYATDVFALKKNEMCKNAINMTCGYHNSFSDSGDEYINLREAKETADLVNILLKSQNEWIDPDLDSTNI